MGRQWPHLGMNSADLPLSATYGNAFTFSTSRDQFADLCCRSSYMRRLYAAHAHGAELAAPKRKNPAVRRGLAS
jgi:hypothetical protein